MRRICISAVVAWLWAGHALATELRPIVLDPSYQHDRFVTAPQDHVRQFRAYTVSFDGADDNDGDGADDIWGLPEWVAYEIKRHEGPVPSAFEERPRPWMDDDDLVDAGVCPTDDSYLNSGYDRGHMCMREIARRLGRDADWNSHTVLNACPQRHPMNAGVWLGLENKTSEWADTYGAVWVICGPVIYGGTPREFIGDAGELPVAIPDAFYKVVVKEAADGGLDVLAFLIPQHGLGNYSSTNHPLTPYLTSVDAIEALTGLDLLTSVEDEVEAEIERVVPIALWSGAQPQFFAGPLGGPERGFEAAPDAAAREPRLPQQPSAPAQPLPPARPPSAPASPYVYYVYAQPVPCYRPCFPCCPVRRVIRVDRCRW
jgi:endonuclease G, mitochondrial